MASIIKNKDIYDPSQGDPLKPLKVSLDMLDDQLKDIGKRITTFQTELREIPKTGGGEELKKLATGVEKLKTETNSYNKVNEAKIKINKQIQATEEKLILSRTEEAKQLAAIKLRLQERNAELKKQVKFDKAAEGSLTKLNQKLGQLRKQYDNLTKEQRENTKVGGNLLKQIQKLDTETKQLSNTTGRFQKNVGNYPGLFNKTSISLKGLGTELLAAGGVVGGVQLLIDGFKGFTAQVGKNIEVTKQLNASFNLGAQQARSYAGELIAIADTFDQDYNEVARAAIVVSKELGVGIGEATGLIEEGFLKGSNNSGEFLDILKEYPVQFQKAGLSAEETFAVINQQVTQGVYSDKGVDAIKEGTIQLTEWTKAVSDSLTPLGENIKLEVQRLAASGKSFEAMQLISSELKNNKLAASDAQAIMSTVFRGAGEDAESFVLGLSDVKLSLDDVAVIATEAEQSSLNLNKSWNEFIAVTTKSGSVLSTVWNGIRDGLGSVLDYFSDYITESERRTDNFLAKFRSASGAVDQVKARLQELAATQKQQATQEETTKAAIETKDKERFAAWQQRQKQIESANNKKLKQAQAQLKFFDKQIEKEEEYDEAQEERIQEELDRQIEKDEELAEQRTAVIDVQKAEAEQLAKDTIALEEEYSERRKEILAETAGFAAETFGNLLASGELSYREFGKFILKTALDIAERLLLIGIAEITVNEVKTKGFIGIGTAAVLTGLVKGVFAGIKSQVQGFAEGTEYVNGPGTGTSDSIPAMLSKGERVVPHADNKTLFDEGIVSNDDLISSAIIGKRGISTDNSGIAMLLKENNKYNSEIMKALHRLGYAYGRDGFIIHHKGDGSAIEKFKMK